ncbi:hypothetical protein AN648_15225, partial [Listeria monocytogenes]
GVHVQQLIGHEVDVRGITQAVLDHVDHVTHLGAFAQHAGGLVHHQRLAGADGAGVHHRQLEQARAAGSLELNRISEPTIRNTDQ